MEIRHEVILVAVCNVGQLLVPKLDKALFTSEYMRFCSWAVSLHSKIGCGKRVDEVEACVKKFGYPCRHILVATIALNRLSCIVLIFRMSFSCSSLSSSLNIASALSA